MASTSGASRARSRCSDTRPVDVIVGHAAVAVAAAARRNRLPLLLLLPLAYLPDIVERLVPGLATGRRNDNWSHALTSDLLFAVGAALMWWLHSRRRLDALLVGAVVASHWFLDAIVSYKPVWPGGPVTGLLLYDRSPWYGAAAEVCVIAWMWLVIRKSAWSSTARRIAVVTLVAGELAATMLLLARRDERHRVPRERVSLHGWRVP